MTESLSLFADEVTRVAKEVGTEGLLGGQAQVSNVGGTWKDLTDNVNVMAANVRDLRSFLASLSWLMRPGSVDVTSADDRARYTCGGEGRLDAEGHGRPGLWRDTRPRQHHQQHDRPVGHLRGRSEEGRSGGRHRRQARWASRGRQRRGYLAGDHVCVLP